MKMWVKVLIVTLLVGIPAFFIGRYSSRRPTWESRPPPCSYPSPSSSR